MATQRTYTHPPARRALSKPHDQQVLSTQLAKVDAVRKDVDITAVKVPSTRNDERKAESRKRSDVAYPATELDKRAAIRDKMNALGKYRESVLRDREAADQPGQEDRVETRDHRVPRTADEEATSTRKYVYLEIPSQEDARFPIFWLQIEDCKILIDFFLKLLDDSAAAVSEAVRPQAKDGADVSKSEVKPPLIFETPLAPQRNKGETESGCHVGAKSKKKGGNGKKLSGTTEPVQTAPKLPVSGEQPTNLIIPHEFLTKLLLLSIPPPTSYDGILQTLYELKMTTKRFEAAQREKAASSFNLGAQPDGGRLSIL
ncbi:hypothetical protein EXIGLDRAFT_698768 [Exidia glandulosa HHB12029]|uniref:Uncharacterized protein n=1 Tax=Exidia glandulosa HHB12029 TaxID=1314781 RepID=A0A165E3E2_EXIGL|nr:hypothetical protein EXIGLDRAFT_698768 [Exidia glandulosa HHB12029]